MSLKVFYLLDFAGSNAHFDKYGLFRRVSPVLKRSYQKVLQRSYTLESSALNGINLSSTNSTEDAARNLKHVASNLQTLGKWKFQGHLNCLMQQT